VAKLPKPVLGEDILTLCSTLAFVIPEDVYDLFTKPLKGIVSLEILSIADLMVLQFCIGHPSLYNNKQFIRC